MTQLTGIEFKSMAGSFWSLYVEAVFYLIIGAAYFTRGRKHCLPALLVPMLLLSASSVLKSLGHPLPIDIISKFGFIRYSWFMVGCLIYERMHDRDKLFHYAIVALAMLIKLNVYIKSELVMLLMPIAVASVLYYIAFLITKYAEPALRNMLKVKRGPAAPQFGAGA